MAFGATINSGNGWERHFSCIENAPAIMLILPIGFFAPVHSRYKPKDFTTVIGSNGTPLPNAEGAVHVWLRNARQHRSIYRNGDYLLRHCGRNTPFMETTTDSRRPKWGVAVAFDPCSHRNRSPRFACSASAARVLEAAALRASTAHGTPPGASEHLR